MQGRRSVLMLLALPLLIMAGGCGVRNVFEKALPKQVESVASCPLTIPASPQSTTSSPPTNRHLSGRSRTVLDPEGKPRLISLSECIAIALENGRAGTTSLRVLSYEPAIVGVEIERALSRFDARLQSSMIWNVVDQPIGTAAENVLATPTAGSTAAPTVTRIDRGMLNTGILKPLATGGVAGITFRTEYEYSNLNATVNPSYKPVLEFNIEQPLLQGAGIAINQLRSTHLVTGGGGGPGILLSRTDFDLARGDFDRRVQEVLYSVEEAYWNLYASYWNLYSRNLAFRLALSLWNIANHRVKVGEGRKVDLAQIEQQYQIIRSERLDALGNGPGGTGVLEAERRLRFVIGLPPEDGCQLLPSDAPTRAVVSPCWEAAVTESLANRQDLYRARQELKAAELTLLRERDYLLPDLRAVAKYDYNGLGNRLDGTDGNALRSLASGNFNNWTLGLRLDVPVGFRDANARVRKATLQLTQRMEALHDLETQAVFSLQASYRQVIQSGEQMRISRARIRSAVTEVDGLKAQYELNAGSPDILLRAQRLYADALRDEQLAVVRYNIALADFGRQKGTLLRDDSVLIAEGPLPADAQNQASKHIRERRAALVIRERPGSPTWPEIAQEDVPTVPYGSESMLLPRDLKETAQHSRPRSIPDESIDSTRVVQSSENQPPRSLKAAERPQGTMELPTESPQNKPNSEPAARQPAVRLILPPS